MASGARAVVFWAFVKREAWASARAGKADRERVVAVLFVAGLAAACVLHSHPGAWRIAMRADELRLARVLFVLVSLAASAIAGALTLLAVAPAIAGEREAKRIDALLTTPL